VCGQHSLETFCLGVFLAFAGHFVFTEVSNRLPMHIAVSLAGIVIMVAVAALVSWYKGMERRAAPAGGHAGHRGRRRMMKRLAFVLATLLLPGTAFAVQPAECLSAQQQLEHIFPLPQTARAIADKKLTVLVAGTGSSTLPGPNGAPLARVPNR
jgi:hypothetical protein